MATFICRGLVRSMHLSALTWAKESMPRHLGIFGCVDPHRNISGSCRRLFPRRGLGRGRGLAPLLQGDYSLEEAAAKVNDESFDDESRLQYEDADDAEEETGYRDISDADRRHEPVMLEEVISFLAPEENQVFLDMTFGGGGHTRALLESAPGVQVYALDRDPGAHRMAEDLSQFHRGLLVPLLGRFSELDQILQQRGVAECTFDGMLIDAGCSSLQFDTPERGFSLSRDGPLDMRMDGDRYPMQPTAAEVVNSVDISTLTKILRTYGEEPNAKKIARAIVDYRQNFQPFTSTQELATVVACTFTHRNSKSNRDKLGRPSHTATRTFQALRIFVNNELNELAVGLEVVKKALKSGGKLAALTFHSLEDRVVKRTLQGRNVAEKGISLRQKRLASDWKGGEDSEEDVKNSDWEMAKKVSSPDAAEVEGNPRARSAKLRTAIRI